MPLKAGVSLHYRLALTKREASEAAPDESGAKAIPDKQNLLKNRAKPQKTSKTNARGPR